MKTIKTLASTLLVLSLIAVFASASPQEKSVLGSAKRQIPPGSKIYIAPMKDGFETFVIAGMVKKQVPLVVVNSKDKADYELTGVSETDKAGWAKMLFLGVQNSNEEASIKVVEISSGEVVYGYSVHKTNSARGKQSAGEACAKHLKESIANKS